MHSQDFASADSQALTTALLVAVVEAVIGAVTAGPLGDTAVVCLAGELSFVTLVVWTHWRGKERHETEMRWSKGDDQVEHKAEDERAKDKVRG